jgi:hypothetical protein
MFFTTASYVFPTAPAHGLQEIAQRAAQGGQDMSKCQQLFLKEE